LGIVEMHSLQATCRCWNPGTCVETLKNCDIILRSVCSGGIIIVWQSSGWSVVWKTWKCQSLTPVMEVSGVWPKITEMSEENVVREDCLWFFMFGMF